MTLIIVLGKHLRFLINLRSLRALSVARTRFCGVSRDPDELPDDEEPESESEYEVSEKYCIFTSQLSNYSQMIKNTPIT